MNVVQIDSNVFSSKRRDKNYESDDSQFLKLCRTSDLTFSCVPQPNTRTQTHSHQNSSIANSFQNIQSHSTS